MPLLLLLTALAQAPACAAAGQALMTEAATRAAALDADSALPILTKAAALGCVDATVAQLYLRGLIAAQDAYAVGGSADSLGAVNDAMAALESLSPRPAIADISRYVLAAAAAAAQSERDQMALYLLQALQLESLQLTAGQPAAPMISAHETAGELWLRVYRYAEARQAFLDALKAVGPTRRVLLGLARAEARAARGPGACPDTQTTCP